MAWWSWRAKGLICGCWLVATVAACVVVLCAGVLWRSKHAPEPSFVSETAKQEQSLIDLQRFFSQAPSVLRSAPPKEEPCTGQTPSAVIVIGHYAPAAPRFEEAIARWKTCAKRTPKRVVILSPDHQRAVANGFAVGERGYSFAGKTLSIDTTRLETLKNRGGTTSTLFLNEHGIGVPIAMVARVFESVEQVMPIVISAAASKEELAGLVELMRVWEKESDTLVVFSVDFSHYLPIREALMHDAATRRAFVNRDEQYMWNATDDVADFGKGLWLLMRLQGKRELRIEKAFSTVDLGGSDRYTTTFFAGWLEEEGINKP